MTRKMFKVTTYRGGKSVFGIEYNQYSDNLVLTHLKGYWPGMSDVMAVLEAHFQEEMSEIKETTEWYKIFEYVGMSGCSDYTLHAIDEANEFRFIRGRKILHLSAGGSVNEGIDCKLKDLTLWAIENPWDWAHPEKQPQEIHLYEPDFEGFDDARDDSYTLFERVRQVRENAIAHAAAVEAAKIDPDAKVIFSNFEGANQLCDEGILRCFKISKNTLISRGIATEEQIENLEAQGEFALLSGLRKLSVSLNDLREILYAISDSGDQVYYELNDFISKNENKSTDELI